MCLLSKAYVCMLCVFVCVGNFPYKYDENSLCLRCYTGVFSVGMPHKAPSSTVTTL